jgi:beta-galactosidase
MPEPSPPSPAFTVRLDKARSLLETANQLGQARAFSQLPTMEELGQYEGFAHYETVVGSPGVLEFGQVRDRAQVFLNGKPIGVLARDLGERRIALPEPGRLSLLVENLGRVNYGSRIGEATGLIGPATLSGTALNDWRVTALDLDRIHAACAEAAPAAGETFSGPCIATGAFDTPAPGADHFLHTGGWGKGVVWVNGFNLGRYWSRGPQRTLYLPAPILRETGNTITVLELHALRAAARFVSEPELGPIEH